MRSTATHLISRLLLAAVCWLCPLTCWCQTAEGEFSDSIDRDAPDFVTASLMMADPGDILYACVGHACLRLECPTFGLDYVFSYESENVQKKVLSFLAGNLKMGMFAIPTQEYCNMYASEQRGVQQYILNLPPNVERDLWQLLDEKCAEGINLPYEYLDRGCAQSVLTSLIQALGQTEVEWGEWPERFQLTRREMVSTSLDAWPWNAAALYALVGTEADADCSNFKKVVVPTDLLQLLQQATINGTPIINSEPIVLVPSTRSTPQAPWITPMKVALLLLLLAVASLFMKSAAIDWLLLAIQTALGLVMTWFVLFSSLPCTDWNWLVIPFNPLPVLLWRWRKRWAIAATIILVAWCIGMSLATHEIMNKAFVILALAFALVCLKQSFKKENKQKTILMR